MASYKAREEPPPDTHQLIGCILSHDDELSTLRDRITFLGEKPNRGEKLTDEEYYEKNTLTVEFQDIWNSKKQKLQSFPDSVLKRMYTQINQPWTPEKNKKPAKNAKPKKVTKATKKKLMHSRLAQEEGAPQGAVVLSAVEEFQGEEG